MLRTVLFVVVAVITTTHPSAAGDAVRGKALFEQCSVCHGEKGSGTQRGPSLVGVVGRPAAQGAAFRYSNAMRRSGITWSEEEIARYLADPQVVVPGNRMPFSGMSDASEGADLAAYLAMLKP